MGKKIRSLIVQKFKGEKRHLSLGTNVDFDMWKNLCIFAVVLCLDKGCKEENKKNIDYEQNEKHT